MLISLPIHEKCIYLTVTHTKGKRIVFIATLHPTLLPEATLLLCQSASQWPGLFMISGLQYLLWKCVAVETLRCEMIGGLCDF